MREYPTDEEFIVGRPRPKTNPLIHRTEIGKPAFHNELPPLPADYTFGAPNKKDAEGAGEVMLTWQCHSPPPSKLCYDFGRDFLTLNKRSVHQGCTTAKEVGDYRKTTDARIKPKVTGKRPAIVPARVYNDPSYSYGSKSGESESVADLLQNRWELEWVQEQRQIQAERDSKAKLERARRMSPSRQMRKVPAIKQLQQEPRAADLFSLKQFRDVPSRFMTPSPTLPEMQV